MDITKEVYDKELRQRGVNIMEKCIYKENKDLQVLRSRRNDDKRELFCLFLLWE